MKEKMLQKRNEKGFTLMEMLIVVAIIAILVAIAIPVFNTQLDKAKTATDSANERAAKAVAVATYLTEGKSGDFFFDAGAGTVSQTNSASIDDYGQATGHTGKIVKVTIDATTGAASINWVAPANPA